MKRVNKKKPYIYIYIYEGMAFDRVYHRGPGPKVLMRWLLGGLGRAWGGFVTLYDTLCTI